MHHYCVILWLGQFRFRTKLFFFKNHKNIFTFMQSIYSSNKNITQSDTASKNMIL